MLSMSYHEYCKCQNKKIVMVGLYILYFVPKLYENLQQ